MKIGVLHPGEMGSAVGIALATVGQEIRWAGDGRSEATRTRASGFFDTGTLADLATSVDGVISLCPPQAASDIVGQVADTGFAGLLVEANAVSPEKVRGFATRLSPGLLVDASIIGPPPRRPGTTRIYLSGPRADEVAGWFEGSALEAIVVGEKIGLASATKMCIEAWRKGSAALMATVLAAAAGWDVEDPVLTEWGARSPETKRLALSETTRVAPKGWRFNSEMREAADTIDAVGLPSGALTAAAEVYDRLAGFRGSEEPGVDEVTAALLEGGE